ncbi:ATP-binding protein [Ekhidna sp. MALMAid0563]|uniref:ATP-binding protein n=1 Tax=Ekhidna sp. MALMAid0563 TaxID=3143937 RepID=UPI0032DF3628
MKVNIKNAIKLFFPNPSLEQVYFEAIANSIDANSTKIDISISIKSYADPDTLSITIRDNGDGFNEKNFEKFTKLLEIEQQDHKGMGRLVFLNYFNRVKIKSHFSDQVRSFEFSPTFDGENEIGELNETAQETILEFRGYNKEKIKSYDYLKPDSLRKAIIFHFFPLFHAMKVQGKELLINIDVKTQEPNPDHKFYTDQKKLSLEDIPELDKITFSAQELDMFENLTMYYSLRENYENADTITAICVDNRTHKFDILAKDAIPQGYEAIFLLYSSFFDGKTDPSRQQLELPNHEERALKRIFGEQIAIVLKEKIPRIEEQNKKVAESLNDRYPHLTGYFEEESIGLIDRNQSLETAQRKFFNAQKEILDSNDLSDDQFLKSLEISSRLLTEYILYRNLIIHKLKSIDRDDSEADIHNIVVPMRRTFRGENLNREIYNNNAWILDDKFMTYTTILSDERMDGLLEEILLEGESIDSDSTRPDIAMVFSSDPDNVEKKLDVVIVELKKLELGLAKKEELVSQLKQRARKLLNYYPDRIQRIWFYGVVDFDKDFIRSLKEDEYLEVFSSGTYFYKEHKIMPDYDESTKIPIGVNVLSFDALLKDAEARNSTFLNLLKEGLKRPKSED